MNARAIDLLQGYSAEVTSSDRNSIDSGTRGMARGSGVFIASVPFDTGDRQLSAAIHLKNVGLQPVASRASLLKYALICGVGPSLRALKERHAATRNLLAGKTPEQLLKDLAAAQSADPSWGISGIHFFAFGSSLASTVSFVEIQEKAFELA